MLPTDPEELDPELDVELGGEDDLDDEVDDDLDGLPDGFGVVGEDDEVDAADDEDSGVAASEDGEAPDEATAADDPSDFEEELATVVRVPEEEDEAPARRAGEFVCTRCFLVKKESQLAVRSRKVCRDCA